MNFPFVEEEAKNHCVIVRNLLTNKKLHLLQKTKISLERKENGLMIGCLVCYNKKLTKKCVLICVSGIAKELRFNNRRTFIYNKVRYKIVPNIANSKQVQKALNINQNDKKIHQITQILKSCDSKLDSKSLLKQTRKQLCDESLKHVFNLYNFYIFNNTKFTLNQIIKEKQTLPQTGTGDCCAPKLLSFAFKHYLKPISLAESYYGKSTDSKINGQFYAPCDSRCAFILPKILGLEILYVDKDIIVVNKQSGLLSVPGRIVKDSVSTRVKQLFPFCIEQPSVHRLDMETSGVLVLAFTKEAHKNLSLQFSESKIQKEYVALLDGILYKSTGDLSPKNNETSGTIKLKFRLDVENRPHQIYDEENGKEGITNWEFVDIFTYTNPVTNKKKVVTKIKFMPVTGRTHQLRLASSHTKGFNLPIVGDTLYGTCLEGERLMLHATYIKFNHPATNKVMEFYCKEDFY